MVGSNQLIEDYQYIQEMTQHERLSLRQTHCGSFERALIEAWFKADMGNKATLEEAFKNTNFDLT